MDNAHTYRIFRYIEKSKKIFKKFSVWRKECRIFIFGFFHCFFIADFQVSSRTSSPADFMYGQGVQHNRPNTLTELRCYFGFNTIAKRNYHIEVVIFCLIRFSIYRSCPEFPNNWIFFKFLFLKICFICSLTFALLEPYKSTSWASVSQTILTSKRTSIEFFSSVVLKITISLLLSVGIFVSPRFCREEGKAPSLPSKSLHESPLQAEPILSALLLVRYPFCELNRRPQRWLAISYHQLLSSANHIMHLFLFLIIQYYLE